MAHFTEQAIINSFVELLNERPFDKITVTDITDRCGVNRNTFYYHYQNIYALVDEMFRAEALKIVDAHRDFDTWQDGFLEATRFARENQTAIYHLYKSINHERLETYLFEVSNSVTKSYIEDQAENLDVAEDDIRNLVIIYTVAIEGLAIEWLHTGMKEDPEDFIRSIGRLFSGATHFILENSTKNAAATVSSPQQPQVDGTDA